jgi:hypothetical protein
MPIIRSEISCHPANLLNELVRDETERCWLIANTLARQEKSLARVLVQQEIPFYLPLLSRRLQYRGRQATSYVPLYPGRVFCFVNDTERSELWATRRVASVWEVIDQSGLQRDLMQLSAALEEGRFSDVYDGRWLSKFARPENADPRSSPRPLHATPALQAP